jgi:serine/threonine-protein kinase HipA
MATNDKKNILVYADWEQIGTPTLMGNLTVSSVRGKESFSFEYADNWIQLGFSQIIDPDLQLFAGTFFPKNNKQNFGVFLDSCPDRWGRALMQRREAMIAKQESRAIKTLFESDYLLGVFDENRMGGLRLKLNEAGPFLNDHVGMATPPWTSLRELEQACLHLENDDADNKANRKWINLLIAPGSSLGGARPKASVLDIKKKLWIAKFPSKYDNKDIAAWEMVVNQMAKSAGIDVAEGQLVKFNNKYHTYCSKRFDRTKYNRRVHFASAMTMLGYTDGEQAAGASYLELMEFIFRNGAVVEHDLEELWKRIVFNICVSNTDDHLRNHGFLLTNAGWKLSPAYDLNPNEFGSGLSINITEHNNALDLSLALEVAPYFKLSNEKANRIIKKITTVVKDWRKVATYYKIPKAEQQRMESAFINN